MKTVLASLALFAASALAQNMTINTPANVVECQPTLLTWSGGTPPYFLSILPGATPNGAALENLPETNSTSYTWTCNIASGTYIGFTLRDSTGSVAQSAPITVNPGSSSCVNVTGAAGPTASSSSGSSQTTAGATTPSASTGNGATTASSGSSPSSTSTTKNGASANAAQLGAAGLVGVAVAALFL